MLSRALRSSCNTRFISSSTDVSLVERSKEIWPLLQKIDSIAEIENMGVVVGHNDNRDFALFLEAPDHIEDHCAFSYAHGRQVGSSSSNTLALA